MSNLTEQNIDFITQVINGSNIESVEMKEDLIDHFCCAIEEEMKKGLNFEKSYDKAYQNICPDGFDEIQRETVFLLTSKKLKAMKRLLFLSGYLSTIGIISTVVMKIVHIPLAFFVLVFTAAILLFLFLPTLFMYLYKRELTKSRRNKLKYSFGFLGFALFIAFVIFKVNHWPLADESLLTSIIIINFGFFPFLFLKMYKKSVE
jgi:hypothetical protein